jgi:Ni/Fe-hydrogenase subunit HybB-like protein
MTDRRIALKSVLWLLVGICITVSLARFIRGLGATTDLSDAAPWGLWIAFDVMSGVALAAGGFVIAAVVYIFHLQKYKLFTRSAILTAFLGYVAVAVGLLYDLGIPMNIWHPIIYPQPRSVLFEVAMCVMLYLTVLFLEFCPVILEHSWFNRPFFQKIHVALKKATIPLVVLGIVLSTLHQSSLGSLFLIAPERVHPLWYSPIIWVLFFVSAAGLGLMTIAAETLFSSWYFGHKLRPDLLSNLGKAASSVLFLYAGLRLGDLALRGKLVHVLDNTWQANVFLLEMSLTALLPVALMAFRKIRSSAVGIGIASGLTLLGMVGYRFNLCVVAFARPEGVSYFPTWMEFAVTLGIVAAAMLVFIFFVERLNVCEAGHEEDIANPISGSRRSFDPRSLRIFMPESLAAARRYSLALVFGMAIAASALPLDVWRDSAMPHTPVLAPMVVSGSLESDPLSSRAPSYRISLQQNMQPADSGAGAAQIFIIDGNRNGRLVAFPHEFHCDKLGGKDSCIQCHHQSMPFDQNTSCYECHRDMYLTTDTFNHSAHIARLDGNSGCYQCHVNAAQVKTRKTAKACGECHKDITMDGFIIRPQEGEKDGMAAGYMDAMHGLCITCHKQKLAEEPQRYRQGFAECATCHRDIDGTQLRRMGPYVTRDRESTSLPKKAEANPGGPTL